MVSSAVARTLRYLAGIEDDPIQPSPTFSAPFQDEQAPPSVWDTVQAGATGLYNAAAAPVSPALGETVRGAVSSAYDMGRSQLPSLPTPQPGTAEALEHEETLRRRGQVSSAIQTAAPVIQRGATGLYDAAQDPTNAVETVERAAIAGYEAGRDEYVPDTPAEIATALTMPPLHASNVAQAAYGAASGEIGRGLGRAAGTSTDPLTTIPGYGPVSSEDIASGVAQTVLDPTNLIGAPAARNVARAAPGVARTAAETAFRAGSSALDDVSRRAGGLADAVTGANLTPAARAAQAAALPAEQGAGFIPSHINDMRTRIIPPDVADTLDFPVRIPEDPFVLRAIQEAGGTVDERGTTLNVIHNQTPEAHGGIATRGMTFHIAGPPDTPNPYASGGGHLGGPVRFEGPTRFRNPLFIQQDAGKGFLDDALAQLGVQGPPNPESVARWERGVEELRFAVDASRRRGDRYAITANEDDLRVAERMLEKFSQPTPVKGRQEIDDLVDAVERRTPKGSPARIAALQDVVSRYGGDPSVVPELVRLRYDKSETGYGIVENIIAANARKNGHDGVIYLGRTRAPFEDVNAHPAVKAAWDTFNAASKEADDAQEALRVWRMDNRMRGIQDPPYEEEYRVMTRAHVAQQRLEQAKATVTKAERQAERELGGAKIEELGDVREARNPTPGAPNPKIIEARQAYDEAMQQYRDAVKAVDWENPPPGQRDAVEALGDKGQRAYEDWKALEAGEPPHVGPSGYTLREDIPRRPGAPDVPSSTIAENRRLLDAEREFKEANAEHGRFYDQYIRESPTAEGYEVWASRTGNRAALDALERSRRAGDAITALRDEPRYTTGSGLGAGLQALLPGPGVRGQLRADAYNAAQGALVGAASEELKAGAEGRETDPWERLKSGALVAGVGVLAGRGVGNRRLRAAARLGSGYIPEPAIPRNLGDGGFVSRGPRAEAHRAAYREFLNAHKAVSAARAEREKVEKFLARYPDDVEGQRRLESALAAEDEAKSIAQAAEEYEQMVRTGDMTLGSGFQAAGDMDPAEAAARAQASAEAAARGTPSGASGGTPATPQASTPRGIRDALPGLLKDIGRPQDPLAAAGPPSLPLPGVAPLRTGTWNHVVDALQAVGAKTAPYAARAQIVRLAGMLSDVAGQTMNLGGNVGLAGRDLATAPLMVGMDMARSAVSGRPREVFAAELGARLHGMRVGARAGLSDALEILKSGTPAPEASKLDSASGFGTDIPRIAPKGSRAAKVTDAVVEAPLRFLGAADAVFRTMAQGGHLMAEATASAMKANGGKAVTPQQVLAAAQDSDLLERVQQLAQRSVLQEDRAPTLALRKFLKESGALGQVVSLELPFVKTPYNVVAQGMEMTPLGLAGVIKGTMDGSAPRAQQRRLAEVTIGTASMGIAAMLYANGNMTGAYPESEAERSTLPPGWKPWSFTFDPPGMERVYLPFENLAGPLAAPAVMTITAMEEQKKEGTPLLSQKMAAKMAAGVGKYMIEQTFFEGFANIAELATHPDRNVERHLERLVAQYSPHALGGGALGGQIQRFLGMPARDPDGMIDALQATHPLTARFAPEKQGVLGDPVSRGLSGPAAIFTRAGVENDDSLIAAYRDAEVGLPLKAPKSVTDPGTKLDVELDTEQQAEWQRAFGDAIQRRWMNTGFAFDPKTLERIKSAAREDASRSVLGR